MNALPSDAPLVMLPARLHPPRHVGDILRPQICSQAAVGASNAFYAQTRLLHYLDVVTHSQRGSLKHRSVHVATGIVQPQPGKHHGHEPVRSARDRVLTILAPQHGAVRRHEYRLRTRGTDIKSQHCFLARLRSPGSIGCLPDIVSLD